jgi:hypothetical protein
LPVSSQKAFEPDKINKQCVNIGFNKLKYFHSAEYLVEREREREREREGGVHFHLPALMSRT